MNNIPRIVFWGTSRFSIIVLDEMAREGFLPTLIVTAPPKPKGRHLELTPSEVKVWADLHAVPTLEPAEIKSEDFVSTLGTDWDLFIIVSYGKIVPRSIIEMPKLSMYTHPFSQNSAEHLPSKVRFSRTCLSEAPTKRV
jgi:methionyl-tRNA formyltransferase